MGFIVIFKILYNPRMLYHLIHLNLILKYNIGCNWFRLLLSVPRKQFRVDVKV